MIKRPFIIFSTLVITLSSFAAFGQSPKTEIHRGFPEKISAIENVEQDIAEALTVIEDNYTEGDELDYNDLFKGTIDSMLHSLDPHSDYMDAKEAEEFRTSQRSLYFGIGATINDLRNPEGEVLGTIIRATFEGAPAQRAGLVYGDLITEINGESVAGKRYPYVREKLRGPRGTSVDIVVKRYKTGELIPVKIVRDAVPQPSISEAYMVKPGVGYIAMSGGFNQTTYNEFIEQLTFLKSQGMKRLVLDLRFNPGGLVREAFYVANTFLNSGQIIITQRGRGEGLARKYRAENPNPDNTPLVVLVNGSTASASEILSGALQDHDRALIVGETTFGKGLITNPFKLEHGSYVLLAIAQYETPSGRLIQRDYSDGRLYDYQTNGGTLDEKDKRPRPKTDVKRTDSGRIVYGGGGISPDVEVKSILISPQQAARQRELVDSIYNFALDLTYGKVSGLQNLNVGGAITYDHDLEAGELRITPEAFDAFKKYAVDVFGVNEKTVDMERRFVERILRSELVTSAYGTRTSLQVFNEYDVQLQEALKLFPQAEQLAKRAKLHNGPASER